MQVSRFVGGLMLACALFVAGATTAGSARAQSDAELKVLNQRVIQLYRAGKYREAIPLAERDAEATKVRHGPDHPEYATALNNLAELLKATNRLGEAEPLYRRALADGLLTASEVAQLELDADWVVLSACNTAAGEKGDAEAISGLARALG